MTNNDRTEIEEQGFVSRIQHGEILDALGDAIHVIDKDMRIIFQKSVN